MGGYKVTSWSKELLPSLEVSVLGLLAAAALPLLLALVLCA